MNSKPLYRYRVENLRVIDGDTVDCDIDLGFDVWLRDQRIRLRGLDAPETRTKDLDEKARGLAARDWLKSMLLEVDDEVQLGSDEFDARGKFGRILGTFFVRAGDGLWLNINDEMVHQGLATPYYGGAR